MLERALPSVVVERHPFIYDPTSTARVNFARLPPPEAYAGMTLAYREQHVRDDMLNARAKASLFFAFAGALLLSVSLALIGQFIFVTGFAVAAAPLSFILLLGLAATKRLTLRRAVIAFVAPIAFFFIALACSWVLLNRSVGSALVAAASWVLIAWLGSRPFDFYNAWLFANPRLRPEIRLAVPKAPGPDLMLLAIVLAIAVIVPLFSTGLAMLAIAFVCGRRLQKLGIIHRAWEVAKHALSHFLTYGMASTLAPGVWVPSTTYLRRWWTLAAILAPFYLALTIGLTAFFFDRELRLFGDFGYPLLSVENIVRSPVGWMREVGAAASQEPHIYLWAFPIALAFGLVLPPYALLAIYGKPLAAALELRQRIEGNVRDARDARPLLDDDGRVEWQWYVDRLKDSGHQATDPLGPPIREADHLFFGIEPHSRFPVLLHEPILSEHAYFVGDSGSGKTSLGLMPLIIQLIRGHRDKATGRTTAPPPLVVLDLKGDPALFTTVKAEAEARGQEFRFFTPEKGRASHAFNPFESFSTQARSDIELCNLMLDALGLNHGEGYGRGYFSRQSRMLLLDALTHERRPRSFQDLYDVIKELAKSSEDYKDTVELVSTVHALTQYPMLAVGGTMARPESAIHMPTVIERRQVVYFWLPAAVESISAREIAKLALYSLLTACIDRQRGKPKKDPRQAYLFIDEFQRIVGHNFKVILEQARSFGLSAILANQSVSDLNTPAFDLRPTVRTNTRLKRYFSVTDPEDIKALAEGSGQEIMLLRSFGTTSGGNSISMRNESLKPRLTVNDVLAASDHPLDSILHVSRGSGYTQFAGLPIIVRSTWPMSRETYEERKRTPWPEAKEFGPGEVILSDKSPVDIDRDRDREAAEKAFELMQSLLAQRA